MILFPFPNATGFIDFIVEPIFVVLGDMLDKMLENTVNLKEEVEDSEKDRKDSISQITQESVESLEGKDALSGTAVWGPLAFLAISGVFYPLH